MGRLLARVIVISRDRTRRVDASGDGGGRAVRIEDGERAVASAQEAVPKVSFKVISRDRSRRVDACGGDERAARSFEGGEGAVARRRKPCETLFEST